MIRHSKIVQEEPIGMYVTDGPSIAKFPGQPSFWTSIKSNNYLPLLDLIHIKSVGEIKFTTGENVRDDVIVFNERTTTQRPTRHVMHKSKLDVTSNDLFAGGITMCLNFTRFNLTVVGPFGIPKMYRPLTSEKFIEFDGKLIFLTIHTLNSERSVYEQTGIYKYLESLKNKRTGSNSNKDREFNSLLNYVINNLESNTNLTDEIASDTLKVCTVFVVKEEDIFQGEKASELYIVNKGFLVTSNNVVDASPHPTFKDALMNDKGVLEAIKQHGIACFINDPDDLIGDRYFNFAGEVIKVPKIKSKEKVSGLYIGSLDAAKSFTIDNITELDKLDQNKYLYKSAEEALDGGDLKAKFMEESEMRKIIRGEEAQNSKLEYEAKFQKLEEEARKNKLLHEEEVRNLNLMLEKIKSETTAQKHSLDTESLYRKTQYETSKYSRDSVVETIKTVGAISALALGIFAVYSKYSK